MFHALLCMVFTFMECATSCKFILLAFKKSSVRVAYDMSKYSATGVWNVAVPCQSWTWCQSAAVC